MTGRNSGSAGVLGLCVVALATMACDETMTKELDASADTVVRTDLDIRRNDNYGCGHALQVGSGRGGDQQPDGAADAIRSLVRFDLEGLDAESVHSAKLQLTLGSYTSGSTSSAYTIQAHRVLRSRDRTPWIEGNGYEGPRAMPIGCDEPDAAAGVAWVGGPDDLNEQGAIDGVNNQSQPDYDPYVEDRFIVNQGLHTRGKVFELDVSDLVADWLSGDASNEGILLRDPTSPDGEFRHVNFVSREGEAADGLDGPRLVLEVDRE